MPFLLTSISLVGLWSDAAAAVAADDDAVAAATAAAASNDVDDDDAADEADVVVDADQFSLSWRIRGIVLVSSPHLCFSLYLFCFLTFVLKLYTSHHISLY